MTFLVLILMSAIVIGRIYKISDNAMIMGPQQSQNLCAINWGCAVGRDVGGWVGGWDGWWWGGLNIFGCYQHVPNSRLNC